MLIWICYWSIVVTHSQDIDEASSLLTNSKRFVLKTSEKFIIKYDFRIISYFGHQLYLYNIFPSWHSRRKHCIIETEVFHIDKPLLEKKYIFSIFFLVKSQTQRNTRNGHGRNIFVDFFKSFKTISTNIDWVLPPKILQISIDMLAAPRNVLYSFSNGLFNLTVIWP